jgi:hypothetical protein
MPDTYSDKSDTLDDMKRKDIDNLEDLMKGRVLKTFPLKVDVTRFVSAMVFGTLEKIGMRMNANMTGEQADAYMKSQGIVIDQRNPSHYSEEDQWRVGTYIYKHNEIVTFVGGARLNVGKKRWELWVASRVMKTSEVAL